MHDPNRPQYPSQPGPPQQQPQRPRTAGDTLMSAAEHYWAEMDGESRIIAAFFKHMGEIAELRRKFLEEHGHLLRQVFQQPAAELPNAPGPSPRIPNGHDPDGATDLARRMAPRTGGR